MVKSLDDTVGRIMSELKSLELDEKTIVFFSSDNGHEPYYKNVKGQLPKYVWRSGNLAEISGIKPPTKKDGISYLPSLLGMPQSKVHDWIFIKSGGPMSKSALITREGYKLIRIKDNSFQLYNILTDPNEHHNIEKDHQDVVKEHIPIFKNQLNSERIDLR